MRLGKTKNTALYGNILRMAWPVMIEECMQVFVCYVDAAMVGPLGASASAAIGICQTPQWLLWGLLRAVGVGLLAYTSRAYGAGDTEKLKRTAGQAVLMTLVTGLIMGVLVCSVATHIPAFMGAEPDVAAVAGKYLLILSMPMLFRAAICIFGSALRGVGDMRTPMITGLIVNVTNIVLNYLMIYPTRVISVFGVEFTMFGFGWGIIGAAIGSAISVAVGGILITLAIYRRGGLISPKGSSIKPDREVLSFSIKVTIPAAAQHIVVCSGFMTFVSIVSQLGTVSLAAHTIAVTAEEAFCIPAFGLQAVAATMCGMAVGANDEKQLDQTISILNRVSFVALSVLSVAMFMFPTQLMSFFTPDKQVIAQGAFVLRIVAFAEPFFGVFTVIEGAMRGIGNSKDTFAISAISMWGVRILGTFICVRLLNFGLGAVWLCMVADNTTRFIVLMHKVRSGSWKRGITFEQTPTTVE